MMARFQFLIGTVKTSVQIHTFSLYLQFQFLIGTVKTRHKYCPLKLVEEFQFLIGTVKTSQSRRAACGVTVVSIPHRYCKNGIFY